MNTSSPGVFAAAFTALGNGLPHLLPQFLAAVALLAAGVALYILVTPFRERELVVQGNAAAGTVLAGAIVGIAIPLAATLATSGAFLDIVVWGIVAVILQLLTVVGVSLVFHQLRRQIEGGNVAAALTLAATQIAIALLNAAVMVPT